MRIVYKHPQEKKEFTEEDYDQLLFQLEGFESLWITSHCLAEVSNLLKQTDEKKARELLSTLSSVGGKCRESHISKSDIFHSDLYNRLGVADTGFVQKSKRVDCSFTVDFDLYRAISKMGQKVLNFNYLRAEYLYDA